jgi:hypothetical protein
MGQPSHDTFKSKVDKSIIDAATLQRFNFRRSTAINIALTLHNAGLLTVVGNSKRSIFFLFLCKMTNKLFFF